MLDVLHDISDGLRSIAEDGTRATADPGPTFPETQEHLLLSVKDLTRMLGVTRSALYGLRAVGRAPTATKIGGRLLFHRADVEAWLHQQREQADYGTRPWRVHSFRAASARTFRNPQSRQSARTARGRTRSRWRRRSTPVGRCAVPVATTCSSTTMVVCASTIPGGGDVATLGLARRSS
jgi:excisionase family DNA binding protein